MRDLKALIRDIPDFPKPGILFRDITPLLLDAPAFRETVDRICAPFLKRVDVVLGIESRGFIVGAAVAYRLGTGLALVRKPGKLPVATYAARYDLEYGTDALEIHHDAFRHRQSRARRRRSARHRRDRGGGDGAGTAQRRRRGRLRLRHRAHRARRAPAARTHRGSFADPVLIAGKEATSCPSFASSATAWAR